MLIWDVLSVGILLLSTVANIPRLYWLFKGTKSEVGIYVIINLVLVTITGFLYYQGIITLLSNIYIGFFILLIGFILLKMVYKVFDLIGRQFQRLVRIRDEYKHMVADMREEKECKSGKTSIYTYNPDIKYLYEVEDDPLNTK